MTHDQLTKIAEAYLYRTKRCGVVFRELRSNAREVPDAIGFKHGCTILIECKISRNDFRKDREKPKHRGYEAMGNYRYYMVPEGMIRPEELPEKWGLIYVNQEHRCRTIVDPENWITGQPSKRFDKTESEEYAIMYSALRRLKIRGVIHLIYDPPPWKEKKNKSNLHGVLAELRKAGAEQCRN